MSHIESKFDLTTRQGVFDHVADAIIKQGKASYADPLTHGYRDGGCRYRGPDDCKCAAGHLVPNDLYDPSMEGVIVFWDYSEDTPFMARFDQRVRDKASLLNLMQTCHDSAAHDTAKHGREERFIADFKVRMSRLAAGENLDPSILETV